MKNHDVNSLGGNFHGYNLLITNFHAENFLGEFLQFGVIFQFSYRKFSQRENSRREFSRRKFSRRKAPMSRPTPLSTSRFSRVIMENVCKMQKAGKGTTASAS